MSAPDRRSWHPSVALRHGSCIRQSATKTNGLSLHPYWEAKPSCGVRWVLAE
ncbi:MAG: hypothetical protein ACYTFI_08375 [Planctomycetota bacterium]